MIDTQTPRQAPVAEVGEQLCSLAGQIAAATSRFLGLLADFDARQGWAGPGVHSCAHWLSWRCGMDLRTAREHVRVAPSLVVLPRTAAEFTDGRLSYSKVRAIARVATPASEDDLVDIALHAPAAHVERLARGLRTADQREPTQNAEDEARRCRTQWRWDDDTGELVFWGRLPAQDGAALLAAATRAEHERTRTLASDTSSVGPDTGGSAEHPDLAGPPPMDLGPALVAMATITCATVAAPVHAVSAEILIHHTPHGAHPDDGPPLTSAAAREMACGARKRSVIDDDDGCILHYGRSRRTPSAAQLRALQLRDRCCQTPGCGRTRFLHAHHVQPWQYGGTTDLTKLEYFRSIAGSGSR